MRCAQTGPISPMSRYLAVMYGKAWLETSASVTVCMIVRAFGPQRPSTKTEPVRSSIETRSPSRSCARSQARSCGPLVPPVMTRKRSSPSRVTVRSQRIPPRGVSIEV
jgi:hypothetical protein